MLNEGLDAVLETGVPGVVVATSSVELAAGVADMRTGAPLTTEHRFLIGSVTKTFVAALVLQLVGDGALAVDEEVGPIAEGVTLRQLLNHTSGLPDYYDDFESLIAHKPNLTPRPRSSWYTRSRGSSRPARAGRTQAATTSPLG
jgi:CubicO group peptidase (beta-lactamase class C family)